MVAQRTIRIALAASLALVWLAFAVPVAACSCIAFDDFDQAADGEHIVVAGTAESRVGDALTIAVDVWFWGPEPAPRVVVTDQPDNMCALGPSAPVGQRWLWVARIGDARPVVNQCLPSWSLDDPDGQAALSRAATRFGGISMPIAGQPVPDDPGSGASLWFIAGAVGVIAIVVFGAAVALSGRRGRE